MELVGRLAPVGSTMWEVELKVCFDRARGFGTVENGKQRTAVPVLTP